jgi:hypothetical protein
VQCRAAAGVDAGGAPPKRCPHRTPPWCISTATLHQAHLALPLTLQYYIKAGYLFPTFHVFYWFGYQTTTVKWPNFRWLDPTVSRKDKWVLPRPRAAA